MYPTKREKKEGFRERTNIKGQKYNYRVQYFKKERMWKEQDFDLPRKGLSEKTNRRGQKYNYARKMSLLLLLQKGKGCEKKNRGRVKSQPETGHQGNKKDKEAMAESNAAEESERMGEGLEVAEDK